MRPPDFLMVSPADVGRAGALGACILALVRYVTALPGEFNGRRMVDGEMWWRASHDDIRQALGGSASRRTVSWTVGKLRDTGDLLAIATQDFYGDRAQAYRASDVPLARSDQGSDVPLARSDQPSGKKRPSTSARSNQAGCADIANLPSVGEFEEPSGGENARATEDEPLDVETVPDYGNAPTPPDISKDKPQQLNVADVEPASRELVTQRIDDVDAIDGVVVDDHPEPAPQPYCDQHMPNGTDSSCGACGRRRRIREKWEQRQQTWLLRGIFSKGAEPAQPVRRQPEPKPEPPSWVPGPDGGPRCRRHGHLPTAPVDCTRCHDAAIAAEESA